ncbi:hypothetical protein ACFSCX_06640 [Bacillus salitolerans]|uniref:Replication initiation protein n=1 Tax=Bacillus salitolerans TaxID=1437434 RepID=A0ABW4LP28_9BACI
MLAVEYLKYERVKDLTAIEKRLLPTLARLCDYDKTIYLTMSQIRDEIKKLKVCTTKLFGNAIDKLIERGYISKNDDGQLVCHFYHPNTGTESSYKYIKHYKFFTEAAFLNLHKRSLELLYYFMTVKLPGKPHLISVEKLYKNKTLNVDSCVGNFASFEEFSTHFLELIETGVISVVLKTKGKGDKILTKDTARFRETFKDFCDKKDGKRKSRMGKSFHVIEVRISESVVKETEDIYDRRSSLRDLESIAIPYGYDLQLIAKEDLVDLHSPKKELIDQFGLFGLKIWRKALEKFFMDGGNLYEQVQDRTFSNYLKNWYIVPEFANEIKTTIKTFADQIEEEFGFTKKMNLDMDAYNSIKLHVSLNPIQLDKNILSYISNKSIVDEMLTMAHDIKAHSRTSEFLFDVLTTNYTELKEINKKCFTYMMSKIKELNITSEEIIKMAYEQRGQRKQNKIMNDSVQSDIEDKIEDQCQQQDNTEFQLPF